MKKTLLLVLALVLCLGVFAACGTAQTPAPQETEATPAPEGGEEGEMQFVAETTSLLDVTAVVSNTDGVVVIKGIETTYTPTLPGESETEDYMLDQGDTVELTIKKDAIIDFPMVDDQVHTVTITGEEFDGEFRDYLTAYPETSILFTYEKDGDQISKMQYFYLP